MKIKFSSSPLILLFLKISLSIHSNYFYQLIHSFHVGEETGAPAKSIASKLLEGNKKDVVRFLDRLSARDPDQKQQWRRNVARTIDRRIVEPP
jgi:hypothetical protein